MKCQRTLLETSRVLKAITPVTVATSDSCCKGTSLLSSIAYKNTKKINNGPRETECFTPTVIHMGISLNHEAVIDLLIYIPVVT